MAFEANSVHVNLKLFTKSSEQRRVQGVRDVRHLADESWLMHAIASVPTVAPSAECAIDLTVVAAKMRFSLL